MAEEKVELPIAEEPKPEVKAEESKTNVDDLIAELERVGIENSQQLQGKLDAGAQAGRLAQLLGDEKKLAAEYKAELEKLKVQPSREEWDMPESRPIDIEAVVGKSISQEFSRRDTAARQAQEASVTAYNTITNDPNFHLVEDIWNEKVKDASYIYQAQTGQVDPVRDFQGTVVDYYKNVTKRSLETIKELRGGPQPAPHIETGETHSPANIVSTDATVPDSVKKMKELQKKVDKGYLPTDDELVDMIDSVAFAPVVPEK